MHHVTEGFISILTLTMAADVHDTNRKQAIGSSATTRSGGNINGEGSGLGRGVDLTILLFPCNVNVSVALPRSVLTYRLSVFHSTLVF